MEGLSEGRIVHFVLADSVCRPAMIVSVWEGKLEDGMVNLQVFLDGSNDFRLVTDIINSGSMNFAITPNPYSILLTTAWCTSVKYSEIKEIGTWHWPERV